MPDAWDVLVIGGGGTGHAAATAAAKLGKRVAMAERANLGGTCLNVGCVPSKALLRSAQVATVIRSAGEFGVDVDGWRPDYPRIVARARALVESFVDEDPHTELADQGITLLEGEARFLSPHDIECNGQRYSASQFVIATGSTSMIPPIPGLDGAPYLTSDQALWLERLPESAVIIGGGSVSCEFASLWAALGVDVTIVSRRLLPREDTDVGDTLRTAFERRGIRLINGKAVGIERTSGGVTVASDVESDDDTPKHRRSVEAASILVATGRRPRCDSLRLDQAGVRTSGRGINVDETMRTEVPHIWAAGDVVGRHMYTHAGDREGMVAGWNAASGTPKRTVDWRVVPRAIYAIPEVAAVGMTEQECREGGLQFTVAMLRYADVTRAKLGGETEGFARIIAQRSTGQILGASIVGAQAGELIGEVAVAMTGHLTVGQIGDTLHPYPTLSEVVRWAAHQADQAIRTGV